MALYEIDPAATRARLDAIAAGGLRALGETARRSAEIDKQVQEMHARQERAKQAMAGRSGQSEQDRPGPPPRTPARPATLTLGAEELRETRPAAHTQAPAGTQPAQAGLPSDGGRVPPGQRPASAQTGSQDAAGAGETSPLPTRRTLMLGAPEDRAEESPAPKERPRRPPVDQDDDMSGRTWLR